MKIDFSSRPTQSLNTAFAGMFGGSASDARDIPLHELRVFRSHPFKVLDDDSMTALVESIRENGVIVPALARPMPDGGYELVSGHRRKHACELAGMETMPVIVRDMSDDEATVWMVDANLQRETMLPSERAWAYRMKLEAMKRQGKRTDDGMSGVKSRDILAEEAGVGKSVISQYIRLTELLPPLLEAVDAKKLTVGAGEALSWLSGDEQSVLISVIQETGIYPSSSQAERLKGLSGGTGENRLTGGMVKLILQEQKPAPVKVTLKEKKLTKYFSPGTTSDVIEARILELLEQYGGI